MFTLCRARSSLWPRLCSLLLLCVGVCALLLLRPSLPRSRSRLWGQRVPPLRPAPQAPPASPPAPDAPPLIADLSDLFHGHCFDAAGDAMASLHGGLAGALTRFRGPWVALPVREWAEALCDVRPALCACADALPLPGGGCAALRVPAAAFDECPGVLDAELPGSRARLTCGGGAVCLQSRSLHAVPEARAVALYHVSLSRRWLLGDGWRRARVLAPRVRAARSQLWALGIMWESSAYYAAGAAPAVTGAFDLTVGSGATAGAFVMSYAPDWEAMLRPFSLAAKLAAPALPRAASVALVQSNCNSRSGREAFLAELMALLPVDSFGGCLNNRDAGPFAMGASGGDLGAAMRSKHALLHGYKFSLAFENSVEAGYVTEKVFDAWEAHALPVYRGAPDIERYVPGPHSLLIVAPDTTPAQLAARLAYLDANDTAYLEYHAWREAPAADIRGASPLAHSIAESDRNGGSVACAVCAELARGGARAGRAGGTATGVG